MAFCSRVLEEVDEFRKELKEYQNWMHYEEFTACRTSSLLKWSRPIVNVVCYIVRAMDVVGCVVGCPRPSVRGGDAGKSHLNSDPRTFLRQTTVSTIPTCAPPLEGQNCPSSYGTSLAVCHMASGYMRSTNITRSGQQQAPKWTAQRTTKPQGQAQSRSRREEAPEQAGQETGTNTSTQRPRTASRTCRG